MKKNDIVPSEYIEDGLGQYDPASGEVKWVSPLAHIGTIINDNGETLEEILPNTSKEIREEINRILEEVPRAIQILEEVPRAIQILEEFREYLESNPNLPQVVANIEANKVDKVEGYGLSQKDFTAELKDKLDGISDSANKTEFATTSEATTATNNTKAMTPLRTKEAILALSPPPDLSGYATTIALDEKVDKVTGKGLSTNDYSTLEKDKLASIEEQANKTVIVDNVTTPDSNKALSAKQGKVLKDELTAHKEEYIQQRQLPHFNHVMQEYVNLDKFWDALRDGKIYTTEFNQFSVSPSPNGTKLDDNAGLVMEPSTNTIAGRDDYSKIGLFKPIEVNAYVDENDDYHVTAIQGDGRFERDGSMGDVYIMNMTGYTKYVADDLKWSISYSGTMHAGFEVIQEAVKPDGTIRPYLLHAKYIAGRNPLDGKLASISGVYAEYLAMSHNHQIAKFKEKGIQYSGKTSHDDFWVQLMMWLKYATTHSQSVMTGCSNYYLQYTNLVTEADVKRVIITNAQANALVVGSTVSIGDYGEGEIRADRNAAQNLNLANRVTITAIEDLEDGNSAVYVDIDDTFDTTLTTTITTYPWNSGGCDSVLGTDGSPHNNLSNKEPFIINKVEMMVGGYEILQNKIILNNAVDDRTDVYVNYDCQTYAPSITSAYDLVGQLVQTNNVWKYGSKIAMSSLHLSVILVTEAEASSTTGTGDGIYTNPPSTGGTRVWLSLGHLSRGTHGGLRCLAASNSLTDAYWAILGRLSATGRSRRQAGVN